MGHTVRLMPPQYVKPYVKTNKNDARDAEAICEAVTRPNMRFVPIKTEEQQAVLVLHRVRDGIVKQRVALSNQIRGLLAEFGIIIPQGLKQLNLRLMQLIDSPSSVLPGDLKTMFSSLYQELANLSIRIKSFDKQIEAHLQELAARSLTLSHERERERLPSLPLGERWREGCSHAPGKTCSPTRSVFTKQLCVKILLLSPRGRYPFGHTVTADYGSHSLMSMSLMAGIHSLLFIQTEIDIVSHCLNEKSCDLLSLARRLRKAE
jgi:hypothetical protein